MSKPKDIQEFITWLDKEHQQKITLKHKTYYESVVDRIYSDFESSDFWKEVTNSISNWNKSYFTKNEYFLFKGDYKIDLLKKSYDSFLSKVYRQNVILNRYFPKPPPRGWITPDCWFEKTNDLVRTSIVVKYLDGIEFVSERLRELANKHGFKFEISYQAREEGYYAVHTYLTKKFEIPAFDWDTIEKKIKIEIQLTTELQDNIRNLTHKFYEERRMQVKDTKEKWQWQYETNEFSVNYLGHILHYLEGVIMEVRNKNAEKWKNSDHI